MKPLSRIKIKTWPLLLLLFFIPAPVPAMEVDDCLGCHGDVEMVGADLLINLEKYDHTAHAQMGCLTCHESVTDAHPDDGVAVTKAACLDCHEEVGAQYLATKHAEYAACKDCHNPHEAQGLAAVSAPQMNQQCGTCHSAESVVQAHQEWLPQADLHISALPCITCHTSSKGYKIVLNITQKQQQRVFGDYVFPSYADLSTVAGGKSIRSLIDINNDNLISLAELRTFNRNPKYQDLRLEGTLVPSMLSHDLSTLESRYDCTFCHASGPKSLQTSFVALPLPGGNYEQIAVEKGPVLEALYGTPDFYMSGSTRNASLNIMGLLIICAGLVMPIGHGTLRFLTRKNRQHKGE